MRFAVLFSLLLIPTTTLFGEDRPSTPYPLRCEVAFTPDVIHYGDIVFAQISLVNEGNEILIVPRSLKGHFNGCTFALRHDDANVFEWTSPTEIERRNNWEFPDANGLSFFRGVGYSLKPRESLVIGLVPIWIPRPETASYEPHQELRAEIANGEKPFRWDVRISIPWGELHGPLGDPPTLPPSEIMVNGQKAILGERPNWLLLEGKSTSELRTSGITFPSKYPLGGDQLLVKPRSASELALLQEWMIEIPDAGNDKAWFYTGAFAHPFYAKGSPFGDVSKKRSEWTSEASIQAWRQALDAERDKCSSAEAKALVENRFLAERVRRHDEVTAPYTAFLDRMKTRTPEIGERIRRAKELEKQLLEAADRPNSTISPMMKEFIVLRGHLVEIRYAEGAPAREKAFDAMLAWISTTKNRDLWRAYLDRIVID